MPLADSFLLIQGSLLQLRGEAPSVSPLVHGAADASTDQPQAPASVLAFNGEVFGGLDVPQGCNDAQTLLGALTGENAQANGETAVRGAVPASHARPLLPWAWPRSARQPLPRTLPVHVQQATPLRARKVQGTRAKCRACFPASVVLGRSCFGTLLRGPSGSAVTCLVGLQPTVHIATVLYCTPWQ